MKYRKFLSYIVAFCLLFGLLPASQATAAEISETNTGVILYQQSYDTANEILQMDLEFMVPNGYGMTVYSSLISFDNTKLIPCAPNGMVLSCTDGQIIGAAAAITNNMNTEGGAPFTAGNTRMYTSGDRSVIDLMYYSAGAHAGILTADTSVKAASIYFLVKETLDSSSIRFANDKEDAEQLTGLLCMDKRSALVAYSDGINTTQYKVYNPFAADKVFADKTQMGGSVTFEIRYDLTTALETPNAGKITITPDVKNYPKNAVIKIEVEPKSGSGFQFIGWESSNGGTFADKNKLATTFTMPDNATTITAKFVPVYLLTIGNTDQSAGTVTVTNPTTDGYYLAGTDILLSAERSPGYRFSTWSSSHDGSFSNPLDNKTTFTMPSSNTTITAYFLKEHMVNTVTNPPDGGSVSIAPNDSIYTQGEYVTLTATPFANYRFKNWSSSDLAITDVSERLSFSMPNNDVTVTANFERTYNVTSEAQLADGTPGVGTVFPPSGSYAEGETVNIIAVSGYGIGYKFVKWQSNNPSSVYFADPTNPATYFTMPAVDNIEIYAIFEKITTNVNTLTTDVSPPGSGVTSPAVGSYKNGEAVNISVTPNHGYEFVGWISSNGGTFINQDSMTAQYIMPDIAAKVTAVFVPEQTDTHMLTAVVSSSAGGGYINAVSGRYAADAEVTIEAFSYTGYDFIGWSASPGGIFADPASSTTTFTMPDYATTITASFKKIDDGTSILTVNVSPNGSGTVSPISGSFTADEDVYVNAFPNNGYTFVKWVSYSGIGFDNETSETTSFKMPASDTTITALFEQTHPDAAYILTTVASPHGSGTVSPTGGSYAKDDVITISAYPNAGYILESWTCDGVLSENITDTITFIMPDSDAQVTATFKKAQEDAHTLAITASPSEGGTVIPTGGSYAADTPVTIQAYPSEGYEFVRWDYGNEIAETLDDMMATFTMPDADVHITAIFEQLEFGNYTLTTETSPPESGTVTPITGSFAESEQVTVTATPREDYDFVGWMSYDGVVFNEPENETATFSMPANHTKVIAMFQQKQNIAHTVIASAIPIFSGTVTPANTSYMKGETVTVTATPTEGYEFVNWTILPENSVTTTQTDTGITFTMPDFDIVIQANFIPTGTPHMLYLQVDPSNVGSVSPVSETGYIKGDVIHISATAGHGYRFTYWTSNGEGNFADANSKETIFTMPNSDVTITAHFEPIPKYSLTFNVIGNGVISGIEDDYEEGQEIPLTAEPDTDNDRLVSWFAPDGTFSSTIDTNTTFTMPGTDVTVTATFDTFRDCEIVAVASHDDRGSVTGSDTYRQDDNATLNATANEGYVFIGWYEDDMFVSADTAYTFRVLEDRKNIVAKFEPAAVITVTTTGGGSVTGGGIYAIGTPVTLKASSYSYYAFNGWYEDNAHVSSSYEYTFEAVTDRTISARFTYVGGGTTDPQPETPVTPTTPPVQPTPPTTTPPPTVPETPAPAPTPEPPQPEPKPVTEALVIVDGEEIKITPEQTKEQLTFSYDMPEDSQNVTGTIPLSMISEANSNDITSLNVNMGAFTFSIPVASVLQNTFVGANTFSIDVTALDTESFPQEINDIVGKNNVYDISLLFGGRKFNGTLKNAASIQLDYIETRENEYPHKRIVMFIDKNGNMTILKNSSYNEITGKMTFKASSFGTYALGYNNVLFEDVNEDSISWAYKYIEELAARGILFGKGNNRFEPLAEVSRAEFVQMIVSAFQLQNSKAKPSFDDVDSSKWYYNAIAIAEGYGLLGNSGQSFSPTEFMTREDMAYIVYAVAKFLNINLNESETSFVDSDQISDYARAAVGAVQNAKILSGDNNNKFNPKGYLTRAQAAVVLYNLLSKIK